MRAPRAAVAAASDERVDASDERLDVCRQTPLFLDEAQLAVGETSGGKDVSISPNAVLEQFLNAARTDVDRQRAIAIDTAVRRIMAGVSFAKAQTVLPSYCFGLLRTQPLEDQSWVGRQTAALAESDMDPRAKSLLFGAMLMRVVGEGVLAQAVSSRLPSFNKKTVAASNCTIWEVAPSIASMLSLRESDAVKSPPSRFSN